MDKVYLGTRIQWRQPRKRISTFDLPTYLGLTTTLPPSPYHTLARMATTYFTLLCISQIGS